jgi:hypothetical protein
MRNIQDNHENPPVNNVLTPEECDLICANTAEAAEFRKLVH